MNETILLAISLIKQGEGFRASEYLCPAGKPSIGYGRNLEAFPLNEDEKRQCYLNGLGELCVSENIASDWLKDAVIRIHNDLLNEDYFIGGASRKAVIVDLVYNLGKKKFLTFKKFIQAMREQDFERASAEIVDSRYYKQTGSRAKRNAEIIKSGNLNNL